jgi:hypothetical protein
MIEKPENGEFMATAKFEIERDKKYRYSMKRKSDLADQAKQAGELHYKNPFDKDLTKLENKETAKDIYM